MKIAVITGSPHKDGTSAFLADNFIRGAQDAGHSVYRFDAAFKNISHCQADEYCHTQNCNRCGVSDDMDEHYPHLLECDHLVLVSPLHYNSFSSQLKTAIDRIYCIDKEMHRKASASLIVTYEETDLEPAVGIVASFKQMLRYWGWDEKNILLAKGCPDMEALLQTEYPKQAYMMGRTLA